MEDDEIVRTIITLGRNLGLRLVAEGVETIEQATKLRDLACGFAQGYYFCVPISAPEATDLLAAKYHRAIQSSASKPRASIRVPPDCLRTSPGRHARKSAPARQGLACPTSLSPSTIHPYSAVTSFAGLQDGRVNPLVPQIQHLCRPDVVA